MNTHITRRRAIHVASLLVGAFAAISQIGAMPASAGIVTTTGSVVVSHTPATTKVGRWESNSKTRLFQEQSNLELQDEIEVDISLPGGFADFEGLPTGTITAGSIVDVYMLHQDAVGRRGNIVLSGSVTFDQEILGVMVSNQTLSASDELLGATGTAYPSHTLRELEFLIAADEITISEDRRTLSFELQTKVALDHIRIITMAAAVPSPGSLALLVLAALATLGRRRRQLA